MHRRRHALKAHGGLYGCLDKISREEVFTRDARRDDFWKREVESCDSVTPRRCLFDKLVELVPAFVGESVSDLLSRECIVLVAQHGNLALGIRRVCEEMGCGEALRGFVAWRNR